MDVFVRKKKSGTIFALRPTVGEDGLVARIINSFPLLQFNSYANPRRSDVRFVQASINPSGDTIVASDCHGNIYAFDFSRNRFSLVKHLSMPCTSLNIAMKKKHCFLAAVSDCSLRCYNIENQEMLSLMTGHDSAITSISIHPSLRYALTTSANMSYLWNLDTFERKRKLSILHNVGLIKAIFIPNSNSILTCFKDNSIFIWNADTLDLMQELKSNLSNNVQYRTCDCSNGGDRLGVAGKSNTVHIWCLQTYKVIKVLQLPLGTKTVRQVMFLPKQFHKDDLLAVVCSNGVMRIVNIATSEEMNALGSFENKITQVDFSANGTFAVCIMDSGILHVYDVDHVIKKSQIDKKNEQRQSAAVHADMLCTTTKLQTVSRSKEQMNEHMQRSKTLSNGKLKDILREYGEFPDKYRIFIWKMLLQVPENYGSYSALLQKGVHPLYADIQKIYPIRSQKLLRVFQRLLSALAYWAPVATECTFFPLLAFPFTKMLQNNQLLAFEVVATVLINWCQKWFDFLPNPPLNILSLVENVLAYHDKQLFQHFIKYGVTTQVYAWSLLETGLSEVFTRREWMKLWDHILINEPAWMLFVIVAYSVVNRGPLLDCFELSEFEQFFRYQNATSVSQVIKETYKIVRTTPGEVNPQVHLDYFKPLNSDQYQLLAKFPVQVKNFEQHEIQRIQDEQMKLHALR